MEQLWDSFSVVNYSSSEKLISNRKRTPCIPEENIRNLGLSGVEPGYRAGWVTTETIDRAGNDVTNWQLGLSFIRSQEPPAITSQAEVAAGGLGRPCYSKQEPKNPQVARGLEALNGTSHLILRAVEENSRLRAKPREPGRISGHGSHPQPPSCTYPDGGWGLEPCPLILPGPLDLARSRKSSFTAKEINPLAATSTCDVMTGGSWLLMHGSVGRGDYHSASGEREELRAWEPFTVGSAAGAFNKHISSCELSKYLSLICRNDSEVPGGCGGTAGRALVFHKGEPDLILGGVAPRFPNVGIVPDDATSRRAAVAERLACSPPTKANRVQSPAESPDFRKWESCRTMSLVVGLSQGSPVSPALSLRRRSILTSITLIGYQALAVKSHPNLFTHSLRRIKRPSSKLRRVMDFLGLREHGSLTRSTFSSSLRCRPGDFLLFTFPVDALRTSQRQIPKLTWLVNGVSLVSQRSVAYYSYNLYLKSQTPFSMALYINTTGKKEYQTELLAPQCFCQFLDWNFSGGFTGIIDIVGNLGIP
ncbi:hypothetical protein PR048_001036 [Dryococelus australis]|uniref:Uncharacterized protein n=1 Tax=Dryococelus australis TaxID=614101 RepID=A0ABQ9IG97_9NEOP|nr:hypothetical protein PR048_001036 [Dryococelus australis]